MVNELQGLSAIHSQFRIYFHFSSRIVGVSEKIFVVRPYYGRYSNV
jgi:hypothetical protein